MISESAALRKWSALATTPYAPDSGWWTTQASIGRLVTGFVSRVSVGVTGFGPRKMACDVTTSYDLFLRHIQSQSNLDPAMWPVQMPLSPMALAPLPLLPSSSIGRVKSAGNDG